MPDAEDAAVDPLPTEQVLDRAIDELLELAKVFDEPVEPKAYPLALLALGHRARTLFQGFLELQFGAVPVASRALLRPMVEINMLVRFLRKDPELHTELWQAEGERNTVTIAEEVRAADPLRARLGAEAPLDDAELDTRRSVVAKARERAIAANLARKSGPVMPSTAAQRAIINEPAADAVYTLVYRIASWDVHTGARAFLPGTWVERNDGTISYESQAPKDRLSMRSLAVTTLASTIEIVAAELRLPIEGDARAILSEVMALEPERPADG